MTINTAMYLSTLPYYTVISVPFIKNNFLILLGHTVFDLYQKSPLSNSLFLFWTTVWAYAPQINNAIHPHI